MYARGDLGYRKYWPSLFFRVPYRARAIVVRHLSCQTGTDTAVTLRARRRSFPVRIL